MQFESTWHNLFISSITRRLLTVHFQSTRISTITRMDTYYVLLSLLRSEGWMGIVRVDIRYSIFVNYCYVYEPSTVTTVAWIRYLEWLKHVQPVGYTVFSVTRPSRDQARDGLIRAEGSEPPHPSKVRLTNGIFKNKPHKFVHITVGDQKC